MRRFLVFCLLLLLVGCGDKAKDLFDTAQLRLPQIVIEQDGKLEAR